MKRFFSVVGVIALVLLLAGVVVAIISYTVPLGPAMSIVVARNKYQPTPAVTSDKVEGLPVNKGAVDKSYCGNTGIMRLVVIGQASQITQGLYGADAIRLVIVNFNVPSAAVLALPAELWVNTPELEKQGIAQTQLNLVYQTVWENGHGSPDDVRAMKATQAVAQTIYDNFEFIADHYVTVEDNSYIKFINTLSGIDITLAEAVDGTSEGYGVYQVGVNHLNGLRTLNFTRLLYPSGQSQPDWWGSLARQDLVLHGMLQAVLKWENIANLPELVKTFRKAITTDLNVNSALDLLCMVQTVGTTADMETVGPPPYLVTIDENGHMIPDVPGIIDLLAQMEGGN
jgi:anionic cell wall polymer biosynthesis LytR-Cps2A-Psr (LCP) family protein